MSPTPGMMQELNPPPGMAHDLARRMAYDKADMMYVTSESQRQGRATLRFVTAYQYIIIAVVALLTIRHAILIVHRRNRAWRLVYERLRILNNEKNHRREYEEIEHRVSMQAKIDSYLYRPLPATWWTVGLENWLQMGIFIATFAINVGFSLGVAVRFNDQENAVWNHIHVVALRMGFMSMAQMPAIFALTGRNSVVQFLTGIEYQHLRFVHKLLALWMAVFGIIHTIDATLAHLNWFGGAGVVQLYTKDYLGQTGIVMLVGLSCILFFSIRAVRMRWYEIFLTMHVLGAFLMLVGLLLHVPALAKWIYPSIAFWAFERVARLVQMCSVHLLVRFQFRKPFVKAHCTLIEGAIVIRVPYKGTWGAGQHAYISVWDPIFKRTPLIYGQSHPFSICNVPSATTVDESGKIYDMVFVCRTRDGMTNMLAKHLASSPDGTKEVLMSVEGPYGHAMDVEQYNEVLLVAGGSGITHCMSMLGDVVHKAAISYSRCSHVKLVWIVQSVEQSIWTLTELLRSAQKARECGVTLEIELYVTRGAKKQLNRMSTYQPLRKDLPALPEKGRGSLFPSDAATLIGGTEEDLTDLSKGEAAEALTIISGRPPLQALVPSFVTASSGRTLVVACGPAPMSQTVRTEVQKLILDYPTDVEIALFEC